MLNDVKLKADLLEIFGYNSQTDANAKTKIDSFCTQLQGAIKDYVKSADVNINSGAITVSTSGSAVAQTGVNSAPVIGNLL